MLFSKRASLFWNRKKIKGFPDYEIDTDGNVYGKRFGSPMKLQNTWNGYKTIGLRRDGKTYGKRVHRLVLETYVSSCPKGKEACHNNGIRNDNKLYNLRWGTRSDNTKDSVKHGTFIGNTKLTKKDVINIIHLCNTKLFKRKEVAKMYNITTCNISYIINRRTWKHIWR